MGVRVSNRTNVCLYCSTTGLAFGPVFASSFDAEDFLSWWNTYDKARPEDGTFAAERGVESWVATDLRELTPAALAIAYGRWQTRQVVEA